MAEAELRLKRLRMEAINVLELHQKLSPVIAMAVQVCLFLLDLICKGIKSNRKNSTYSKLHMGYMECMGNMFSDLWWWFTRQKQS